MDYVLENIIYRPRDILQFFVEAQKTYSLGKKFTQDKIQTILFNYSYKYFVEAMRDELTGFFSDDVVTALPNVFSKLGTRFFRLTDFEIECRKYTAFENVIIRSILEKLFEAGYIGQHRPRDRMDYTVFSYRNPMEKFVDEHECIIHRGLTRALTM